jgi:hypothetical protein
MDGNSISKDTTDLEQFSIYEPDIWNKFEYTGHYKYLEELSLYIPEKYQREYEKAFKDYMNRIYKDVNEDYEIRETRKKA